MPDRITLTRGDIIQEYISLNGGESSNPSLLKVEGVYKMGGEDIVIFVNELPVSGVPSVSKLAFPEGAIHGDVIEIDSHFKSGYQGQLNHTIVKANAPIGTQWSFEE